MTRFSLLGIMVSLRCLCADVAWSQEAPADAQLAYLIGKYKSVIAETSQFEIHGEKIIYNNVFEEESYSRVLIQYDEGKALRIEILPYEIRDGMRSKRSNRKTGNSYTIKSEEHSVRFWTNRELIIGYPDTGKLTTALEFPVEKTPARIDTAETADFPAPPAHPEEPWAEWAQFFDKKLTAVFREIFSAEYTFATLFAVRDPGFFNQYDWTITRLAGEHAILTGELRHQKHRNQLQTIAVMLDQKTGRPLAQKIVDPSENMEVVITFQDWRPLAKSPNWSAEQHHWDYDVFPLPAEDRLSPLRRLK